MQPASLITSVAAIQRLEGVAGVLLFKGRNIIYKQMPFSDGRALDLMDTLAEMLDGYRNVRRRIRQLLFQFDGGMLLVLVQEQVTMVFFLTTRAELDIVSGAGNAFLRDSAAVLTTLPDTASATPAVTDGVEELVVTRPAQVQQITQQPEPRITNWGTLRKQIEALLGKVMGRAQVGMMIDRLMAKHGLDDPYRAPPEALRKLAVNVIEQVPNTAKRAALLSELEPILEEHSL